MSQKSVTKAMAIFTDSKLVPANVSLRELNWKEAIFDQLGEAQRRRDGDGDFSHYDYYTFLADVPSQEGNATVHMRIDLTWGTRKDSGNLAYRPLVARTYLLIPSGNSKLMVPVQNAVDFDECAEAVAAHMRVEKLAPERTPVDAFAIPGSEGPAADELLKGRKEQ